MLKSSKEWQIIKTDDESVEHLSKEMGCSKLIAQLLINRGYLTPDSARSFLHSDSTPYHDPFLLKGMETVIARLTQALQEEEKILVFGDYDADGVTSTSLLVLALRELGAQVSYYIPDRFREGYGPNIPAIDRAKSQGFQLVVTVDSGISAEKVARHAKEIGLDYIVTDHHEPPPVLPEAFAIINPKQPGCPYPFKSLAGVGVAFKLVQALLDEVPTHLLDLVAVGTIADLVPLEDENRRLVKDGLKILTSHPRQGLQALLTVSGQSDLTKIDSEVVGFQLGPRLNAAGRLQHASLSADLLMSEDREEANQLAEQVDHLNQERKKLVEDIAKQAIAMVEKLPMDQREFLIVAHEEWHEGVLGIVASRLVEAYYRPALVLSMNSETGMAKGSARSIEGFDLFQSLSTARDLLPHFGGHEMAAGLSLEQTNIEELRDRMNRFAHQILTEDLLIPKVRVDAMVKLEDVTTPFIEEMTALEPYGVGNPKPKFILDQVFIQDMKQIGSNKDHLKLSLTNSREVLEAVSFRNGHLVYHMTSDATLSVLGELGINEWNGFRKPQLFIEDISIEDWQLFDLRGQKKWKETLIEGQVEDYALVYFRKSCLQSVDEKDSSIIFYQDLIAGSQKPSASLVFLDLPESVQQLEALVSALPRPERIYMVFDYQEEHFFESVPTREHFKAVFGLFRQHQNVTVEKLRKWGAYKGWPVAHIDFIIKVFLELEFVKMEKDSLLPVPASEKKPLTDSQTFQNRLAQTEVEELFLYSPRSSVKKWLDERLMVRLVSKEDILS